MKKYLILLALGGFVICLDQLTKIYIHTQFQHGESISVIHNFFNITYVRNPGAAFGFLRDAHETLRTLFFLSVPPIAALIIVFMIRSTPMSDLLTIISLSLIFGGAIGNYIDRLWHGFVVDFLDFHYKGMWSYPAFNVADIAIVTGICLMLLMEVMRALNEKKMKKA
ncbi:MAG: signal peptidase II [Bdellovibrionales bacterium]|nr:signal peptidase II [Bdellovibrionales bacterium]